MRLECVHSNGSITEWKDEIQVVSMAGNNPTTKTDLETIFEGLMN